jgi:hypothetical protein
MSAVLDAEVTDVIDTSEGTALVLATTNEKLEITEVLDAAPKDGEGKTITGITPLKYDLTDAMLAQFKAEYAGAVFKVDTPEGKAAAKEVVGKLKKMSKTLAEAYTAWNAPILAMTANARTQRDYGVAELAELIKPIQKQLDDQRAADEAEATRKAVAESRRIDEHTAALTAIQKLADNYVQASVADITTVLADLKSFDYLTRRDWQEYMIPAQDAQRVAIETLEMHLTNAKAREQLAEIQAEQARKDAERQAEDDKREADRQRTEALRERITNIQLAVATAVGTPSANIQKTLDRLERVDATEFGDMQQQAQDAINASRTALNTLLTAAQAQEATAAQAAAQTAELDRLRQAEEARQAEENRKREEAEQAERDAAAQRERDEQAARDAAEARLRENAQTLLSLLIEARPHVANEELAARIDAAVTTVQGE